MSCMVPGLVISASPRRWTATPEPRRHRCGHAARHGGRRRAGRGLRRGTPRLRRSRRWGSIPPGTSCAAGTRLGRPDRVVPASAGSEAAAAARQPSSAAVATTPRPPAVAGAGVAPPVGAAEGGGVGGAGGDGRQRWRYRGRRHVRQRRAAAAVRAGRDRRTPPVRWTGTVRHGLVQPDADGMCSGRPAGVQPPGAGDRPWLRNQTASASRKIGSSAVSSAVPGAASGGGQPERVDRRGRRRSRAPVPPAAEWFGADRRRCGGGGRALLAGVGQVRPAVERRRADPVAGHRPAYRSAARPGSDGIGQPAGGADGPRSTASGGRERVTTGSRPRSRGRIRMAARQRQVGDRAALGVGLQLDPDAVPVGQPAAPRRGPSSGRRPRPPTAAGPAAR